MNILVIDDDRNFRATYEIMLGREGYDVTTVPGRPEAEAALASSGWDVVLLDQNLLGAAGGAVGLELIETIRAYSPGAQVIVVSGFAEETVIKRAFALGVDDYLVKSELLKPLLLAKLRTAERTLTQVQLARLSSAELRKRMGEAWRKLQTVTDRHEKGRLLESLVAAMLASIEGFEVIDTRITNGVEEFDVTVRMDGPRWSSLNSPYLLVECKNWSMPVGRDELDIFAKKMERRKGRCTVGVFVAWSGFTGPFQHVAAGDNRNTVVLLDHSDLAAFIASKEPEQLFKSWIDRAVLGAEL